jgi:two-component system OmpR family sensor kinase
LRKNFFFVSDTGVGIKPDKLNEVFDRYSRFNHSVGGFGIGLNIVKSIIDEYGLHIEVSSIINEGTTFKVVFQSGKDE